MPGDIALKTGRDFHPGANFFIDDLLFPCGRGRDDLDFVELLEPPNDFRRVFATKDHDFWSFFLGLADQGDGHGAKTYAENREEQQRDDDGGNESAAVAQGFGEFLLIDDTDIAQGHVS